MRILVTGAAGYVGSRLVPYLIEAGHEVRPVDLGVYGLERPDFTCEPGDISHPDPEWFEEIDAVINLAGVSTDPMAEFSPHLNYEFNAAGTALLAQMACEQGIERFVQASTCSIYGRLPAGSYAEESDPVHTRFPYALSKLMAERALEVLSDGDFEAVILRKGTICGYSPRTRLDLVINTMVKTAQEGTVYIYDADVWRPILSMADAVEAYRRALTAPPGTYNVASENLHVQEMANRVAAHLKNQWGLTDLTVTDLGIEELRSYAVSTEKMAVHWNWRPDGTVEEIVDELMQHAPEDWGSDKYLNLPGWEQWLGT